MYKHTHIHSPLRLCSSPDVTEHVLGLLNVQVHKYVLAQDSEGCINSPWRFWCEVLMPDWRSRHIVRGHTAPGVQKVRADREDQDYQALPEHLRLQEDRLFHIPACLQDLWSK